MQQVSQDIREQVLALKLTGHTIAEIREITKLSSGAISNFINQLDQGLSKLEIETVCMFYYQCKKMGLTNSRDIVLGTQTHALLKRYELAEEEVHDFLSQVYPQFKNAGLEASELVEGSKLMIELQESLNTPLKEVPSYCKNLVDQVGLLEETIEKLKRNKQDAENSLNQTFDEKDLKLEMIEEYESARDGLAEYDVSIDDLPTLSNMLQQVKLKGYDVAKIVEHTSRENTYEQRASELVATNRRLEAEQASKVAQNGKLQQEIEQNRPILDQIDRFSKINIDSEDLAVIYKKVLVMAKEREIDPSEAFEKLKEDIEANYDKKLGFDEVLESHEEEISIKSNELVEVSSKLEKLKTEDAQNMAAINVIKKLRQGGIDKSQIMQWNKILESSGNDLSKFGEEMQKFGQITTINGKLQSYQRTLEENVAKLQSRRDALFDETIGLESYLNEAKNLSLESMKQMESKSKAHLTESAVIGIKAINYSTAEATHSVTQVAEQVKAGFSEIMLESKSHMSDIFEAGSKLGQMEALVPVHKIIMSEGLPETVFPIMITILSGFRNWLAAHKPKTMSLSLGTDRFVRELKEEFSVLGMG